MTCMSNGHSIADGGGAATISITMVIGRCHAERRELTVLRASCQL